MSGTKLRSVADSITSWKPSLRELEFVPFKTKLSPFSKPIYGCGWDIFVADSWTRKSSLPTVSSNKIVEPTAVIIPLPNTALESAEFAVKETLSPTL